MVVVDQCATMSSEPTTTPTKTLSPVVKENPIPLMTNGEAPKEKEAESSEDDEDKLVIHEEKKETKPSTVTEVAKGPLKRPVEESSSSEIVSKKSRTDSPNMSPSQLESAIAVLKKDLEALEILMVQKEEEWNSLLRLTKHKEELYARLVRKQQTNKISNGGSQITNCSKESEEKIVNNVDSKSVKDQVVFLPEGSYAAIGDSPLMLLKHFLGSSTPQVVSTPAETKKTSNGPASYSNNNNVSIIDIHTPKASQEISYRDSVSTMKPILPKPPTSAGSFPTLPSTGYGPQGPTVSIHQIIAAHRKSNPQVPPIRGAKRGAWRHRFDYDKRGSSRESDRPTNVSSSNSGPTEQELKANFSLKNNNNNSLPMSDPSVSYKDVLLQFAQLTQNEKNSGSPQISIIPVSDSHSTRRSEPIPDSTSVSRELSSQSSNLEGSSALAKLLMESGANTQQNDLVSGNLASPQHLTLSALLSGGTTTTIKDKQNSSSQSDAPKKNGDDSAPPSTNPKCQGCHKTTAKFVCAGCGNQWYCSRNCQVAAWEDHSEHCTM